MHKNFRPDALNLGIQPRSKAIRINSEGGSEKRAVLRWLSTYLLEASNLGDLKSQVHRETQWAAAPETDQPCFLKGLPQHDAKARFKQKTRVPVETMQLIVKLISHGD